MWARPDASSRKGLLEVARRVDGVVDLNPNLDLLGVVLVGVTTNATRVPEETGSSSRRPLPPPVSLAAIRPKGS